MFVQYLTKIYNLSMKKKKLIFVNELFIFDQNYDFNDQ